MTPANVRRWMWVTCRVLPCVGMACGELPSTDKARRRHDEEDSGCESKREGREVGSDEPSDDALEVSCKPCAIHWVSEGISQRCEEGTSKPGDEESGDDINTSEREGVGEGSSEARGTGGTEGSSEA